MKKEFKAVTLYFSGVCNLNCVYCFQPKIKGHMGKVNREIVEWIKSGRMEDDIIKNFGDGVEILSLWGGEPTLNLPFLADRLEQIKQKLPNFNSIFFSTNISTDKIADNIIDFLLKAEAYSEKVQEDLKIEIQFSLDGPSDFNDCARVGSYSDDIVNNIDKVLKAADGLKIKNNINFMAKATHSGDNIRRLSNYDEMLSYLQFFEKAYEKWSKSSDRYPRYAHTITLVYPGNYTKEDGLAYLRMLEVLEELKEKEWRFLKIAPNQLERRVLDSRRALERKNNRPHGGEFIGNMNCSAGEGFLGLAHDGNLHICQSSFFIDEDSLEEVAKKKLITEFEESLGYSFNNFGMYIKDKVVINPEENEIGYLRMVNYLEKYRRGIALRIQYFKSIIPVLVANGDILSKYSDKKEAEMLASAVAFGGFSCPATNIWQYGNYWIHDPSPIILLGNGVLDYVIKKWGE